MAVEDEIVRFVAEMSLDEKDQEEFVRGLQNAESQCESLRSSIKRTTDELAKMSIQGKEGSDEFKNLEKQLKADSQALKAATRDATRYSSVLGINQMSLRELRNEAKTLRTALNSMHKDANPQLWEKYNSQLIAVEKRMSELKIGTVETKESFSTFFNDFAKGFTVGSLATSGINGTISILQKGFQSLVSQTQVWGDAWTMTQAKVSAGWNQFISNIGQGNLVIKSSINDAIAAAEEAQLLRDELFERQNSLNIQEIKMQTEINALQAIVNDRSNPEKARLDALNKILQKEKDLAELKESVAIQEQTAVMIELSTKTKLTSEEDKERLANFIEEYNVNIDQIRAGQEYNALLKKRVQIQKSLNAAVGQNDQWSVQAYASQIEDIDKEISKVTDKAILGYAEIARQYDLGNDTLVENYVAATIKVLAASRDLAAAEAAQARKRGTLVNQIQAEAAEDRNKAMEKELSDTEKSYNEQLNALKSSLLAKEITETEYKSKSAALEISFLNQKKAINQAYGLDVTKIDGQIYDKRLGLQTQFNDKFLTADKDFSKLLERNRSEANKSIEILLAELNSEADKLQGELEQESIDEFDRLLKKANTGIITKDARIAESDAYFETEMAELENLHNLKLISEEEFLARKSELVKNHSQEIMQIETEGWKGTLSVAGEILGQMSAAISSAREAEYASLDAWKERELAAAGDNAEKREQIEAEYEAKKLDIQKKYADIDMGIQIAKAIAAGALATIQAWSAAGGNPILAGIYTALIAATAAAQVATIVAQRNAIKNASSESASPSPASGNSAVGFSEGGYTGDGGRTEVAGVVHRGEYVVPQPELRDPYVRSLVASIESRRRQRTSRNALPGFAEGGYTGALPEKTMASSETRLLNQIYRLLSDLRKNPIKAYTVLSEMEAKQDMRNRFKRMTSLRRN